MRVLFVGPHYPVEMPQFVLGLHEVGAEVIGLGDASLDAMSDPLRRVLRDYLRVPQLLDEADTLTRTLDWLSHRSVDRVVSLWEPTVILAARLRERLGLPGMSVDTVRGFRDKQLMKERVSRAGLRVPRAHRAGTVDEARDAAQQVGFPLVVKPIAGAGSADTYVCRDRQSFDRALEATRRVPMVSVEEYIEGEEFTYDTVCLDGEPVYENVAQYLPKPIEARSNEWISPVIITVRDLSSEKFQNGLRFGRSVLRALGMKSGFTHMEWFYTPAGEVVLGEIGCRPGGARLVDQMNYTSDIDLFQEWARVECWGRFEASTERKYNCGIIFKRAQGQGRIAYIDGVDAWLQAAGGWAVENRLLPVGAPRRNWRSTLVSDGYLIVRHPDWEEAKRLSFLAATGIKLWAR